MTAPDGRHYRVCEADGIEVVDATDDLVIHLLPIDQKKGVPGDPRRCALAHAYRRMVGPKADAYIWRGIAMTKTVGEDGLPLWERRRVSVVTFERIRQFDLTGKIHPAGYRLNRVTISQQLEYRRNNPWKKKIKKPGSRRVFVKRPVKLSLWRNGSGQFNTKLVPRAVPVTIEA